MTEIKPTNPSGAPEMGGDEEHPAERIDRDAGLSPGALQNGAAAGAIGGRKANELFQDDADKAAD